MHVLNYSIRNSYQHDISDSWLKFKGGTSINVLVILTNVNAIEREGTQWYPPAGKVLDIIKQYFTGAASQFYYKLTK